jgi:hypothetical protein
MNSIEKTGATSRRDDSRCPGCGEDPTLRMTPANAAGVTSKLIC